MILYTGQRINLATFREQIDPRKSSYVDQPNVRNANERLRAELGTDQFVFCSQVPLQRFGGKAQYHFDHVLDVNAHDILAVLEGWVWYFILHGYRSTFLPVHVAELVANDIGYPDPQ